MAKPKVPVDLSMLKLRAGKKRTEEALERLKPVTVMEAKGESKHDPNLLDRENAFLLYASFSGDVTRTAAALHADVVTVLRVVDEDRWNSKLKSILELKQTGKPGEIERAINRTMNFVQCHRLRMLVERQIRMLSAMSDEELKEWCMSELVTTHKDGSVTTEKKLHTRPFADLATAMEKVHSMTYMSLADTNTDRARREKLEQQDAPTSLEMHSAIAKAMSEVASSNSPRALLFDEQLKQAQSLIPLEKPIKNSVLTEIAEKTDTNEKPDKSEGVSEYRAPSAPPSPEPPSGPEKSG